MGRPRKYKIIEDIDQVKGVSIEQLIEQGNYLVQIMGERIGLDDYEVNITVHDAAMTVMKKMNAGIVDKFDYLKFKDYFFIALKNGLRYRHNQHKYKFNFATEELTDYNLRSNYVDQLSVKDMISKIAKKDTREIVQLLSEGYNRKEISKMLNVRYQDVCNRIDKLKKYFVAYLCN